MGDARDRCFFRLTGFFGLAGFDFVSMGFALGLATALSYMTGFEFLIWGFGFVLMTFALGLTDFTFGLSSVARDLAPIALGLAGVVFLAGGALVEALDLAGLEDLLWVFTGLELGGEFVESKTGFSK